jgi:hypothetical protein
VQFVKKNIFQSISTDAWDIEVFNIDGSLFFGLSQLGHASFRIFKWFTDRYGFYFFLVWLLKTFAIMSYQRM